MVANIAWLVFIRAGSTRFPGKCFSSILGKNALQWISDRSRLFGISPQDVILCTSFDKTNQRLIDQATVLGHQWIVGPEVYPIKRLTNNKSHLEPYKYIVRICGDSPFYPFAFVRRLVETFELLSPSAITNTRLRCFPSGYSIEIYDTSTLLTLLSTSSKLIYKEHMSEILLSDFYDERNSIDILPVDPISFFTSKRYTLDYPDDIHHLEQEVLSGRVSMYDDLLDGLELAKGFYR